MLFDDYESGDTVVATVDFIEPGEQYIPKGETDLVESVSSNHHNGLQLNLVKHGVEKTRCYSVVGAHNSVEVRVRVRFPLAPLAVIA